MSKRDLILGIDPGTKCLGWAMVSSKGYVTSGHCKAPGKYWVLRADRVITDLVNDLPNLAGVAVVYIEMPKPFLSTKGDAAANSGSTLKLAALVGRVWQFFSGLGIPTRLITVSQWKGQTPKHITQRRMARRYNIDTTQMDHNEVDALGIASYAAQRHAHA